MGAYSVIGIVNMALSRIGQPKIAALTEDSTAAVQANLVWPMVRDEVLEAADWDFATTRAALAKSATVPEQGFSFAYPLPADFLRLASDKETDPRVAPQGVPYVIEALADGTRALLTNYDNEAGELHVRYVRREENQARWSASFVSALAFRLAAELALVIAESLKKYDAMITLYDRMIRVAGGVARAGDSLEDETGNSDWDRAGR